MKKPPNPKRLLVEGVNDKHVLWALLQHHQVPENFEVRDKEGYENLRDTLEVELIGSGTRCIGIEERLFPPQHEMKAKIHTWLAWQRQPGTPMGQAITNHYLSADTPQALLLIDWLRRLFNT